MNDFNFFQWIRDGVRKSVLLGVADAVDQIGSPEDSELKREVLTAIENKPAAKSRSTGKKRLGRSLKEIAPQ